MANIHIHIHRKVKDNLVSGSSKEALRKNIAIEIEAGKDPKQAAAIAYSVQRHDSISKKQKLQDLIDELSAKIEKLEDQGVTVPSDLRSRLKEAITEWDATKDMSNAKP